MKLTRFSVVAALVLGLTGCAKSEMSPTAPTPPGQAEEVASAGQDARTAITLRGIVRNLNAARHQFMLTLAPDDRTSTTTARLIRWNDQTEVWAGGHRIRPRLIENGMPCEVVGVTGGDAVLAHRITLVRRAGR